MILFIAQLVELLRSIKKIMWVNLKLAWVVIYLGVFTSATASNAEQWQAVELKVDDGLPDSTVYSMAQDKEGFMWFGTTNGLARYDGYSFKVFRHDGADENTLSNNNAGNIYLDSNNRMWIGTFGGGANVLNLNDGKLRRYPYSNSNLNDMIAENVQTFIQDKAGNIWIGTGSGLYQLNGENLKYYGHSNHDTDGNSQSRVWDLEEDRDGHIWIGTSHGLSRLNVDTGVFSHFNLPEELTINISSNQFRTLQMVDDLLWIGSSTGLFSFNLELEVFKQHSTDSVGIKINDIHVDDEGQFLIASMEGLYEFSPQSNAYKINQFNQVWQTYSHLDIRQILQDRAGLLWLATRDNGVVKIDQDGGLFQLHTDYMPETGETEKSKQVWTIITDTAKNLFIGTSDTVFKQPANGVSERLVVAGLGDIPGIIRTLKPKLTGGLWVGTSEGLYVLSAADNQVTVVTQPFNLVGIDPTDVFSVTETLNGDLWLALYNVGVLRWNPEHNTAELLQAFEGNSLTDMNISVIFADSLQHIWIGSNLAGIFKYQPDSQTIEVFSHEFGNDHSLSSNRVKDIFQDSVGRIWIATARGLNLFMPETQGFKQYTQADGLLNDAIGSIVEDSNQNLWLTHQFGLSRFNPEKQEINNYMLNEAISNYGFGNRSSAIGVNDVLYIGSVNGYYTFDPKLLKSSSQYQPPIKLTQVWINSQPLDYSYAIAKQNTFDLFYEDRSIAFEFAALDYKSPEHIKYRYRIMGLNDEWLNISSNRQIELNHLNPGDYQIEVKAINNDGRWTEQMMAINLNIHPVWWNKGWVQLLFACLVIILALFFHQLRTHKIRKQNLLLEDEVKSRTSELHDLNVQLKKAAHSDYLTKLPNRMAFIKAIEEKPSQGSADGDCIVMADIDYFKQINDQYGHAAGDLILVKVGELMREMIRAEDLIARWGGEEFIFYFKGKGAKQVLPMIDRIRATIEKAQFKYAETIISVTLTFGICQSHQGMSLNDCIIKADEAMYAGKAQGRNAVIIADSEVV